MADLEANFMHLQLMHESLSRFEESFGAFLYGLNMNAFCVDFPEVSASPGWDGGQKNGTDRFAILGTDTRVVQACTSPSTATKFRWKCKCEAGARYRRDFPDD
jgi:DASH complex subunit Dam1